MRRYEFEVWKEHSEVGQNYVVMPQKSKDGRWVRFDDAAKLQDKIDALESELEEIKKQGV